MTMTTNSDKPKAALYARVSTAEQAERDLSIPAQLADLAERAGELGYEVAETFADAGVSGESWDRPGLSALRKRVARGDISVVLMRDRMRLGRDGGILAGLLQREFEPHGTRLQARKGLGGDSPEGQLLDGIMDQIARFQLVQTRDDSRRGKLQKARRGEVLPGRFAPYGYRYDGESATYVVNEQTAPNLRRIFRLVGAEGKSMSHVKRVFEREGIAPPGGGRFWHVSTIRRIIDDEIYVPRKGRELKGVVPPGVYAALGVDRDYGIYWFNRSRVKRVYTGERVVSVTANDPAKHVAIPVESAGVPAAWVLSARGKVSANVKVSFAGGRKRELSGGLLRCPCGSAMTVFTARRKSGKRVFHYVCGAFRRHGKEACEHWKYHAAGSLEERVRDFVYRLISDPESLREELRETHEAERQDAANADKEERALMEIISEADAEKDRIVRLYARGGLTDEQYDRYAAEIDDKRSATEERLRSVRSRLADALREDERARLLDEHLRELPDLIDHVPTVREYETVPEPRTPDNPFGLYTLTPDRIRQRTPEELEEIRQEHERERAARYRWVYELLGLTVVAHRDGTLEITWGPGKAGSKAVALGPGEDLSSPRRESPESYGNPTGDSRRCRSLHVHRRRRARPPPT